MDAQFFDSADDLRAWFEQHHETAAELFTRPPALLQKNKIKEAIQRLMRKYTQEKIVEVKNLIKQF